MGSVYNSDVSDGQTVEPRDGGFRESLRQRGLVLVGPLWYSERLRPQKPLLFFFGGGGTVNMHQYLLRLCIAPAVRDAQTAGRIAAGVNRGGGLPLR